MSTIHEKPPRTDSATVDFALPMVSTSLRGLRWRIGMWFLVEGIVALMAVAVVVAVVSFLLDYFFHLDPAQRTVVLAAMALALLVTFARRIVRPLAAPLSDDALILEVERKHPQLAESLISAVQFRRLGNDVRPNTSRAMIAATIDRGAAAAEKIRFADVINASGFTKNALLLLFLAAAWVAAAVASTKVPHLRIWFERNVLLRSVSWPQNTYLRIVRAENGRLRIPRGDDYSLLVEATAESRVIPKQVFVDFRDGRGVLAMKATTANAFEVVLANVIQPFQFRVRGGDERTDYVTVELVEPPAIDQLKLEVTFPTYAGGKTEPLPAGKGPYFILPGSSLALAGIANKPLTQAQLAREAARFPLIIESNNHVSGKLTPRDVLTGQYAIELLDTEGLEAHRPTSFGLRLRADREPRVKARLTGIGGMVTARAQLPLSCRVTDDYGLNSVSVPFTWRGDDQERKEGAGTVELPAVKITPLTLELSFDEILDLEPLKIPPGTGLTFHVAAADNDDFPDEPSAPVGPNIGKSPDFSIRVVTDEELRADLLRRKRNSGRNLSA